MGEGAAVKCRSQDASGGGATMRQGRLSGFLQCRPRVRAGSKFTGGSMLTVMSCVTHSGKGEGLGWRGIRRCGMLDVMGGHGTSRSTDECHMWLLWGAGPQEPIG